MGIVLALYLLSSAAFMAGAARYLERMKKPPEVITEVETRIIQAPPEVRVVRCRECKHRAPAKDSFTGLCCTLHGRVTAWDAFCSHGEVAGYGDAGKLTEADKAEVLQRIAMGERIKL